MINSSQDSGNFILRPLLSRYKMALVTGTVHTNQAISSLKHYISLFHVVNSSNRVSGCSTSSRTLETWFSGHIQIKKYYICSTCFKNSTSNTSKTLACNFKNTVGHTELSCSVHSRYQTLLGNGLVLTQ